MAAQNEAWEAHKAAERQEAGGAESVLDGVALALPALLRAAKISRRAARIGFDWPDAESVIDKIEEEIDELEDEIDDEAPKAVLEEEVGDLLFAVANLARKLDVEPETALAPRHREIRAPLPPGRDPRPRARHRPRPRRARGFVGGGQGDGK